MKARKWIWFDPWCKDAEAEADSMSPPDEMPAKVKRIEPAYPTEAAALNASGVVHLNTLIDAKGRVCCTRVLKDSGTRLGFEEAAISLARNTRWKPAIKGGKRVSVWITQKLVFSPYKTRFGDPVIVRSKWDWQVEYGGNEEILYWSKVAELLDSMIAGLDGLPNPDEFVFTDVMPEVVNSGIPVYPVLARKAGITGNVWLKILIGTNGVVLRAIVMEPAATEIGFEESALQAAIDAEWHPASVDGRAVPVWAAYEVKFMLDSNLMKDR